MLNKICKSKHLILDKMSINTYYIPNYTLLSIIKLNYEVNYYFLYCAMNNNTCNAIIHNVFSLRLKKSGNFKKNVPKC